MHRPIEITGLRGGQRRYSNLAVRTALTLRVVFSLPLRQTEGFLDSLLRLMGLNLKAPDHTTLSRRNQIVAVPPLTRSYDGPIDLIVDSTGLKILGNRRRRCGGGCRGKSGGRVRGRESRPRTNFVLGISNDQTNQIRVGRTSIGRASSRKTLTPGPFGSRCRRRRSAGNRGRDGDRSAAYARGPCD